VTSSIGIPMTEALALAAESQPPGLPPPLARSVATVTAGATSASKVE
jgi:hypothetical protein